ncbi:MAG: hypothetical protein WA842_13355 [Croceibacterium sp.]
MKTVSPLEIVTRVILGLSANVTDQPFGPSMLARGIREIATSDEIAPEIRHRFFTALADALDGRDSLCSVNVVRTGRRGQPGSGAKLASIRARDIAFEVRDRCDKARLGPAAETQENVLLEIAERYGIGRSQVHADLEAGRAAIRATRANLSKWVKSKSS